MVEKKIFFNTSFLITVIVVIFFVTTSSKEYDSIDIFQEQGDKEVAIDNPFDTIDIEWLKMAFVGRKVEELLKHIDVPYVKHSPMERSGFKTCWTFEFPGKHFIKICNEWDRYYLFSRTSDHWDVWDFYKEIIKSVEYSNDVTSMSANLLPYPEAEKHFVSFVNSGDSLIGHWKNVNDIIIFSPQHDVQSESEQFDAVLFNYNMKIGDYILYYFLQPYYSGRNVYQGIKLKDIITSNRDTVYHFEHWCKHIIVTHRLKDSSKSNKTTNEDCVKGETKEFWVKKPFEIVKYANNDTGNCNSCFYFSNTNIRVPETIIEHSLKTWKAFGMPMPTQD